MSKIKVLVADDHPVVMAGLQSQSRSPMIDWVGAVSKTKDLGPRIRSTGAEVVIAELRLGGKCLLEEWQGLTFKGTSPVLIVFSRSADLVDIVRAAVAGAYDFIVKTDSPAMVLGAIQAVVDGKPADPRGVLADKMSRLRKPRQSISNDIPLTRRELQVLKHVALGLSNREIARSLKISIETVKEHIQNILRKLKLNDRTQAAVWAVRRDLI